LRAILEEGIKPWMETKGLDSKDFGFRIGCDFGNDDEVLWGSFGYQNVGEVSATGLPVDMASKLQGLAGKNQTMLGQGAMNFINWPDKYSDIKTQEKNGETVPLPVVKPNLTDNLGNPINYKMRELSYHKSLEFSALPREFRESICNSSVKSNPSIQYSCYIESDAGKERYISASKFLDPDLSLIFEVVAQTKNRIRFPLKVLFRKTNHGKDTPEKERDIEQEAKVRYIKKQSSRYGSAAPISKAIIDERTLYRGLHTMKCEVYDADSALLFRDWIGVMIK